MISRNTTRISLLLLAAVVLCYAQPQASPTEPISPPIEPPWDPSWPVQVFLSPSGNISWESSATACTHPSPCPEEAPCAPPAAGNITATPPTLCHIIFIAGTYTSNLSLTILGPTVYSTQGNVVATGHWQVNSGNQPISVSSFTSDSFIGFSSASTSGQEVGSGPIGSFINSNIVFKGQVTSSHRASHLDIINSTLVFAWASPPAGYVNGFADKPNNDLTNSSYSTYIENSHLSTPLSISQASLQHYVPVSGSSAPTSFVVVGSILERIILDVRYNTFQLINSTWIIPANISVIISSLPSITFKMNQSSEVAVTSLLNSQPGLFDNLNVARLEIVHSFVDQVPLFRCDSGVYKAIPDIWIESSTIHAPPLTVVGSTTYYSLCSQWSAVNDHLKFTSIKTNWVTYGIGTPIIMLSSSSETIPYNIDLTGSTFATSAAPSVPAALYNLNGYLHLPSPQVWNTARFALPTITGSSLELTGRPVVNGLCKFKNSRIILAPLSGLTTATFRLNGGTQFVAKLNASTPNDPITIDALQIADSRYGLQMSGNPQIDVRYSLAVTSPVVIAYSDYFGDGYNITTTQTVSSIDFTFSQVACSARCLTDRMINSTTTLCSSSIKCPCQQPWDGNYCECSTTGLVAGLTCANEGLQWISNGDLNLPSSLGSFTLPTGYGLTINGDASVNTGATVSSESVVNVAGVLSLSASFEIHAKLLEHRQSGNCLVYSDVQINADSLALSSGAVVKLYLDVSQLSTDGSCVTTTTPQSADANATIHVTGGIDVSLGTSYNIKLVGANAPFYNALSFTAPLLKSDFLVSLSGNVTIGGSFNSGSSSNCGAVIETSGVLSIKVGCATTPPVLTPTGSAQRLFLDITSLVMLAAIVLYLL